MSAIALKRRNMLKMRGLQLEHGIERSLWEQLVKHDLVDWTFTMFDVDGVTLTDIANQLGAQGIGATEATLLKLKLSKRQDWLYMQAQKAAMERHLQTMDGDISDRDLAAKAIQERLVTLSLIGDMSAKDVIAARTLEINEQRLEVQKLQAQRALYELQLRGAEFVAEVLRDEQKAAELRELAKNKGLTGDEFIQAVRSRVYGSETVAKPPGTVSERRVDGEIIAEEIA